MLIPETIGTLASLLSIISHLIRFSDYLSPNEKRALNEAHTKIRILNPSLPIDQARPILMQAIKDHVPEPEVAIAMEDLSLGLQALEIYAMGVNAYESPALPAYGIALTNLLGFINLKLLAWKCLEAWGNVIQISRGTEVIKLVLLPMPNTDKAFRTSGVSRKLLPKTPQSGKWYVYGYKTSSSSAVAPMGLLFTQGKYVAPLPGSEPTLLYSTLLSEGYHFLTQGSIYPVLTTRYPIEAQVSERIAAGFLDDLIDYSRRVRGEVQKSKMIQSRLSGLLKK